MERTNNFTKFVPNKRHSTHNNVGIIGVSCQHLYEDGMLRSMNPNSGYKMLVFKICQFVSLMILIALFFALFTGKVFEQKK